jgi:antitoxin YefM
VTSSSRDSRKSLFCTMVPYELSPCRQSHFYAIILYMTTLPVADARANLSKLIDQASSTNERFEITKNGRRAAVLIGADDYDAMRETIEVLSEPLLLQNHLKGRLTLTEGDYLDADQLTDAMNQSGRHARS